VIESTLFFRFGVALVIGIMVGLQREYAYHDPDRELSTGVRTFALMGLSGCTAALAADMLDSPWPFVGIVLILGLYLGLNYFIEASRGEAGLTTETAAILTMLAGALSYWNHPALAVALGVVTTVLLTFKLELHRFARIITREDVYATLKFAVITAVVLPVLPNRNFGPPPFDVLNPYTIWLLVVFISGISFVGYVLIKVVGPQKGIGLTGLLGGLASSTALTLSFTQRSTDDPALARPLALGIIAAWTVMFARVVVAVTALNITLVQSLWLPITIPIVAGLAYALYLFFTQQAGHQDEVSFSNPFELGPAIKFGVIFTVVLLVSKAGQVYLGDTGIYISSFVSGLADADAIALSLARLSTEPQGIDLSTATQAIVLAAAANTLTKGMIVMVGGSSALRRAILPGFLLMMGAAIAVIIFI